MGPFLEFVEVALLRLDGIAAFADEVGCFAEPVA
jgi:hypothetical protein